MRIYSFAGIVFPKPLPVKARWPPHSHPRLPGHLPRPLGAQGCPAIARYGPAKWKTRNNPRRSKFGSLFGAIMKTYRVEEMAGDQVVAYHVANARAPWEAAQKVTGKDVLARRDEHFWVRVTDEGNRAIYKYAFRLDAPDCL